MFCDVALFCVQNPYHPGQVFRQQFADFLGTGVFNADGMYFIASLLAR